jgi:hypothetical protein
MKNISKEDILEDKIRYYKKWVIRRYDLKDFEVIDSHVSEGIQYYVVSTVVNWNVTSSKGKSSNGISYNIITLIENDHGFLVKGIKSLGGNTSKKVEELPNRSYVPKKPRNYVNTSFSRGYKVTNVAYNDTLNVRKNSYSTRTNKVGELLPDARNIKIIKCKYNRKGTKWCKIRHNDYGYTILGWVIARCITPQNNRSKTYRVVKIPSNDTLSVRANAGTRNRKIDDLAYYATGINIIRCKKASNGRRWCKVSHPSIITGWVRSKYLRGE